MSTLPTLNGKGVCYNYQIKANDNIKPIYVSFNHKDQVVASGALTCEEAKNNGYLNATEPPKKNTKAAITHQLRGITANGGPRILLAP